MRFRDRIRDIMTVLDSNVGKTWLVLAVIIALAVLPRAAGLIAAPSCFFANDGPEYMSLAKNLHDGLGFVSEPRWYELAPPDGSRFAADYSRPPVMTVLGAFLFVLPFDWMVSAKICAVIVSISGILAVFFLAREISERNTAALFASAVFAFYPYAIYHSLCWSSENLFLLFLTLSLMFAVRSLKRGYSPAWAAAGGAALALAVLTRPQGAMVFMLLGAAGLLLLAFTKEGKLRLCAAGAVFCLAALAVFSPWMIRNLRVAGVPTPLTFYGAYTLAQANSDLAYVSYKYIDTPEYKTAVDREWEKFHSEKKKILEEKGAYTLPQANVYWKQWALDYIKENPERFFKIVGCKLIHCFRASPSTVAVPSWVVAVLRIYFCFFWTLLALGMYFSWKIPCSRILYIPLLSVLAAAVPFLVVLRFRYPCFAPSASIFAGYAIYSLLLRLSGNKDPEKREDALSPQ